MSGSLGAIGRYSNVTATSSARPEGLRSPDHPVLAGHCPACDAFIAVREGQDGSTAHSSMAGARRVNAASEVDHAPVRGHSDPPSGDRVDIHGASGSAAEDGDLHEGERRLKKAAGPPSHAKDARAKQDPAVLSEEELEEVEQLRSRDREVRTHEQAHKSVAGAHAGAIHLDFKTGPDGRRYAVGGEVPVDLSPISGDPAATVRKMDQLRRAALAPADPSPADRRAATQAGQLERDAQAELARIQAEKLHVGAPTTKGQASAEDADAPEEAAPEEAPAPKSGPPTAAGTTRLDFYA